MKPRRIFLGVFILFFTLCSAPSLSRAADNINIVVTQTTQAGAKDTNIPSDKIIPNSCAEKVYNTLNTAISALVQKQEDLKPQKKEYSSFAEFIRRHGYFRLKITNPNDGTIGKIVVLAAEPEQPTLLGKLESLVMQTDVQDPYGCRPLYFNDSMYSSCFTTQKIAHPQMFEDQPTRPASSEKTGCEQFTKQLTWSGIGNVIAAFIADHPHEPPKNQTSELVSPFTNKNGLVGPNGNADDSDSVTRSKATGL